MKSVRNRRYSGPYFPAFRMNTERYSGFLRIWSECRKVVRTRITPNKGTFYAAQINWRWYKISIRSLSMQVKIQFKNNHEILDYNLTNCEKRHMYGLICYIYWYKVRSWKFSNLSEIKFIFFWGLLSISW